jgi:hypothetical protein
MLSLHEKYIIDDKGRKTAIMLPYSEWKKVLAILEEHEDIHAYDEAKTQVSNHVSFTQALKEL